MENKLDFINNINKDDLSKSVKISINSIIVEAKFGSNKVVTEKYATTD